jgi:hypothetical protein
VISTGIPSGHENGAGVFCIVLAAVALTR